MVAKIDIIVGKPPVRKTGRLTKGETGVFQARPAPALAGEWRVESGEWRVESGEWRVESAEWRVGSGKPRVPGAGKRLMTCSHLVKDYAPIDKMFKLSIK